MIYWIVTKELVIFLLSLLIFPLFIVFALNLTDHSLSFSENALRNVIARVWNGPGGLEGLWFKLLLPYLGIQVIRALRWAQRSLVGRRWSYLYFSSLLVGLSAHFFYNAWDLLYFMYALGDLPEELVQFFQLEGMSLLGSATALFAAVYCFRIFVDPRRNAPASLREV